MDQLNYQRGVYQTPAVPVSLFARMFPSLAFYPEFIAIVFQASAKAKRGEYDSAAWARSSKRVLQRAEKAGISVEITGTQHIQAIDGPCVFISNHMSMLETMVLPGIIQPFKEVTFVVKQSLLDYPVFKHVMRTRDPVAVGRVNPREDFKAVLDGGAERLANGRSIVVFPQTTRTATFQPEHFNTIGVKLAKKAGVPIVPIALKTDAWANGKLIKDLGKIDPSKRVHFAFAEPRRVQGNGHREHQDIVDFICAKLQQWQEDAPKPSNGA